MKDNNYRLLYLAQEGRCFYCRRPLNPCTTNSRIHPPERTVDKSATLPGWTRDHFKARSLGGKLLANVVLSCSYCNSHKAAMPPTDENQLRFEILMRHYRSIEIMDGGDSYNTLSDKDWQRKMKNPLRG